MIDMTSKGRERNKRGEGAQLREEIVSAATRLLDGGTEQSVTLRAVAREAGITAPSIYSHFADRESILLAVAQDGFAELERLLREASAGSDDDAAAGSGASAARPGDPVERLRAVCAAYLDFAVRLPGRYRILFGAAWDAPGSIERVPGLAAEVDGLGMGAFGVLAEAVADCAAAGRSASKDARVDAAALWVGLHGFAQLQTAASLFPWPDGLLATIVDRLALLQD
ncbi:TetR/AcrR family transcriptional regulator [Kribbella ginsengisoli]|uniref:TetR/AcrR family transcriptional regulator n=2 Tax=Kribbella ginsengisoli TaxID=363865 RepID=A0ABP6YGC7_9ACTN